MAVKAPHLFILGAGINGCALARELLLAGARVTLVEAADVAFGATAYSSRLIHGGLRYLEYGEFDLVRESLEERTRLLRLAPQFVRPLELAIPLENLTGGFLAATGRLLHRQVPLGGTGKPRGMLLVKAGLALYDAYARDPTLPRHRVRRVEKLGMPVDASRFRWLATYYDAQVRFPERFTLALLTDAQRIAAERGTEFRFWNYHHARLAGGAVVVEPRIPPLAQPQSTPVTLDCRPDALVNATGAWVDRAWDELGVSAPRRMGGTKGSHLFTFHAGLQAALAGRGVYAEAADGRPIFITPLGDATLIGTTDEPFADDPATAVPRDDEVDYLLASVGAIFPGVGLRRQDIAFSYCGVRPLPRVEASSPAAITRRHAIDRHDVGGLPCYALIGGKLTTARSLAEEAAGRILTELGAPPRTDSRERLIPGAEDYPTDDAALAAAWQMLAERYRLPIEAARATWDLVGSRAVGLLAEVGAVAGEFELVPDTSLPVGFVRRVIDEEWVVTLDDLVERRLMLLYDRRLSRRTLARLAQLMVDAGRLRPDDVERAVDATSRRLAEHFGKRLD